MPLPVRERLIHVVPFKQPRSCRSTRSRRPAVRSRLASRSTGQNLVLVGQVFAPTSTRRDRGVDAAHRRQRHRRSDHRRFRRTSAPDSRASRWSIRASRRPAAGTPRRRIEPAAFVLLPRIDAISVSNPLGAGPTCVGRRDRALRLRRRRRRRSAGRHAGRTGSATPVDERLQPAQLDPAGQERLTASQRPRLPLSPPSSPVGPTNMITFR